MLGKLVLYSDEICTKKFTGNFGHVLAGETKTLPVYARNEGNTALVDLKVTAKQVNIIIEHGEMDKLSPDSVWKFQIIWTPEEDAEEAFVDFELMIAGYSYPIREK